MFWRPRKSLEGKTETRSGCQGKNGKQAIGGAESATITIGGGVAIAMAMAGVAGRHETLDLVPKIGIVVAATGIWPADPSATAASARHRVLKVSSDAEHGRA